jgi:hypothetical protein
VVSYKFKDGKEAQPEVDTLMMFHFKEEIFHRYDSLKFVNKHFQLCKYKWPYESEAWKDKEIHRSVRNYNEVIFRMRDSTNSKENSTTEKKIKQKTQKPKQKLRKRLQLKQ